MILNMIMSYVIHTITKKKANTTIFCIDIGILNLNKIANFNKEQRY